MIISPQINIILDRIIFTYSFHQVIKGVIKKRFCLPGVFHYTEVVEDAEGSAFFDQVSNKSTDIQSRAISICLGFSLQITGERICQFSY